MGEQQQPLEDLQHIKQMMERSSRFISLSGLSGIAAGICALAGAWFANDVIIQNGGPSGYRELVTRSLEVSSLQDFMGHRLFQIALYTFCAALFSAFLFTWLRRKISRTQSAFLKEKKFETEADNEEPNQKSYEELLVIFQDTEEKKENISRALSHLTKNQIRIIKMKFFDNLTYIQIAAETNLTTRTVYNTIYMAIQHLREDTCLKQYL